MGQILGVSTSGYYDWLKEREYRAERDQQTRTTGIDINQNEGKGTYGVERICGCMRREGKKASYQVVKRIIQGFSITVISCLGANFSGKTLNTFALRT